jgi:mevalonate kinase
MYKVLKKKFYSNGKLLITAEYVVLDGAVALAIPTRLGQSLIVETVDDNKITWVSLDVNNVIWFQGNFDRNRLEPIIIGDGQRYEEIATQLSKILQVTKEMNPSFLAEDHGWKITAKLDFPRDWGLGSSSTLINNIAQWAEVNAFDLLNKSFGGSGYDIAAAQNDSPILYSRNVEDSPIVETLRLSWQFTEELFLVHLNQKQDSKDAIAHYRRASEKNNLHIDALSEITKEVAICKTLSEFTTLMSSHEEIISSIIHTPTVKKQLFRDYPGLIKSLGGWGGDFVLVSGNEADQTYFRKKGYDTIIPFTKMMK